jgi:regulator of nucleoside diphosphate kinase
MIADEAERLTKLAISIEHRMPEVSELLLDEIARAHLHDADRIAPDVVTMFSTIRFSDEASGAEHTVRLVYPSEADISAGRMSILTPVGAGLIGLRQGQSISWPDRSGRKRILTILAVEQPVRAGATPA